MDHGKIIKKAKGFGGQLELVDDKVIIRRKGLIALFLFGSRKKKELAIERIFSIQFKEAGITSGFIRLLSSGETKDSLRYIRPRYGDLIRDENAVLFNIFQQRDFAEIKERIEERIAKIGGRDGQESRLKEIRKLSALLDKGIISQEEFEREKKRILRL